MISATQFDILTLFPKYFDSPLTTSIITRAAKKGAISVNIHNLRDFALDSHKTVDDSPYGGGAGMVMKVDVLVNALDAISKKGYRPYVILLDPKGRIYKQRIAERLSKKNRILLVCGHYEGIDERFSENWADEVISVGDYILSGGEPSAIIIVDSVTRLKPRVLGNVESKEKESFSKVRVGKDENKRILDYPVYTRPAIFKGLRVPQILLSGNHEKIESWRLKKALDATKKLRPDLLDST